MKLTTTTNIITAAFTAGIVAAIIQFTQSPINEKKLPYEPAQIPVNISQKNSLEKQDLLPTFSTELLEIRSELKQLHNLQNQFQQTQNSLLENFVLLKDSQSTQDQAAINMRQISRDAAIDESNVESQLSRLYTLDKKLQALDSDAAWESEAVSTITNGFENINLEGSSLQTLQCQGTTCRIEVAHSSKNDADLFLEETFKIVPWNHRARIELVEDENNGVTSIYYAMRDES